MCEWPADIARCCVVNGWSFAEQLLVVWEWRSFWSGDRSVTVTVVYVVGCPGVVFVFWCSAQYHYLGPLRSRPRVVYCARCAGRAYMALIPGRMQD